MDNYTSNWIYNLYIQLKADASNWIIFDNYDWKSILTQNGIAEVYQTVCDQDDNDLDTDEMERDFQSSVNVCSLIYIQYACLLISFIIASCYMLIRLNRLIINLLKLLHGRTTILIILCRCSFISRQNNSLYYIHI